MPQIITRPRDEVACATLIAAGVEPNLAALYAARGVTHPQALDLGLGTLLAPAQMLHLDRAAALLQEAISAGQRLLIVADYDADGATACAVGMRALAAMGAKVDYIVPDRFRYGYGLTPEIVALASERQPDWIITVDNGIASVDGVAEASKRGIKVLITDHHLPGATLPEAACIINPNQPGDTFPSKHLAGVGVIFYLMLALRARLRTDGAFASRPEPNLAALLDLVALGTVADVVRLDHNNRVLVEQGLTRIRRGQACAGIRALFGIAGREPARATTYDLGFVAGPRLNAAGRLDDMAIGIECLLCEDIDNANRLAATLDSLNRERRSIEAGMQDSALSSLAAIDVSTRSSVVLFDPNWHQGVVGILASRLREKVHRPVIAFASDGADGLRGSGRSIRGLHLRDALDLVSKRFPNMITRFGGHAAAAGLSLPSAALADFVVAFEAVVSSLVNAEDLQERIETDGPLDPTALTLDFAQALDRIVWGQGFPLPSFTGRFVVVNQRVVGEKHLKLRLRQGGRSFEAIRFGSADTVPDEIDAVYRPALNEYRGETTLQLLVEHVA